MYMRCRTHGYYCTTVDIARFNKLIVSYTAGTTMKLIYGETLNKAT